ncbi:MAG TPA: bifunctional adenosylcobinamide kinase/adenosylcobinamide-phosphate guanylyltransferase [Acidimicrobiia bacterium]|nr:bifunctional adenosylcobinamide kinase/adenosylcobinamide-phosphate guanylyltransferase [Acidimicrobiia bacterium]
MITLVLGGVRSGKSEVAERLAGPGPGTYLATGLVSPGDDDFAGRVARHRARRPAAWATVEEPRAVPGVLSRLHGPVLLDALGTWIANDLRPDIDGLVEALVTRRGDTIIVSEEVGLGVHPVSEVGRAFADRLGEANRRVAEVADRCLLVVAGRVMELPTGGLPDADGLTARGSVPPAPDNGGVEASSLDPRPFAVPAETSVSGGLRQALSFLTALGGAAAPSPAAFPFFPLVGALLGLVLGALWWTTEDALGPLAAAGLVVAADLALTGMLHFDGLLDSADGLLPHLSRQRRLAVMAEPHVGAFAVATGATTLLIRAAALAALASARPLLLAALWTLSRTAMAVTALTGRYARSHGLASSFLAPSGLSWVVTASAGIALAALLALLDDPASVGALIAAGLAAAGVALLAQRRIGGFTGDTLGAGGVVAETVGLLTAVAVLRP